MPIAVLFLLRWPLPLALGRRLACGGAALVALSLALLTACGAAVHPRAHAQVWLADCPNLDSCLAACNAGRGSSCYAAGAIYETGAGTTQSYPDAAALYLRACDGGEPRGCNDLGVLREIGLGGTQDYRAAAALYERGCNAGDAQGCANLAARYEEGLGVLRDRTRARALRQQACSLGVALACQQNE